MRKYYVMGQYEHLVPVANPWTIQGIASALKKNSAPNSSSNFVVRIKISQHIAKTNHLL